jgi:hypothetical protein
VRISLGARSISIKERTLSGPWVEVRIHALATALVAVSLVLGQPRTTLVFGGVTCFVVYLFIAVREARKSPLWLTPLSFYFFWYSIGLGISSIYAGLTLSEGESVRFASDQTMVPLEDLASAYVLYLVGSLALHVGIQLFRPTVAQTTYSLSRRNLLGWLAIVWFAGLMFQLSPQSFSFLGAGAKILSIAIVGSVCGFAITQSEKLGISRPLFATLLFLGTAGVFFGNLASGSKAYIMFSFLPVFWLCITKPRLRTWIPMLALGLATFYFFIVAPVVYTAREKPLLEGEDPRQHIVDSFNAWMKERPEVLSSTFVGEQVDQFLNRQFDVVPVGFIVGEVNSSGLLMGDSLKYAGYAFIPRVLWPDKPTVTRGAWFSTYLGLSENEAEATTSVGMTATGELYWNFGTAGVAIGMLIIGCLVGLLWRMAGSDPRGRPLHILLYVSTMLSITDMPEAVTVFVSITVTFITFKVAFIVFDTVARHLRGTQNLPPLAVKRAEL